MVVLFLRVRERRGERESVGDLIVRDHSKIVFLIKSDGLNQLSHGRKEFLLPTLNATCIQSSLL
jgi:hypothetical protein